MDRSDDVTLAESILCRRDKLQQHASLNSRYQVHCPPHDLLISALLVPLPTARAPVVVSSALLSCLDPGSDRLGRDARLFAIVRSQLRCDFSSLMSVVNTT